MPHQKNLNSAQRQDIETAQQARTTERGRLENLYEGFFNSRTQCKLFTQAIPPEFFRQTNPIILDAGSSQGTLGGYLQEKCTRQGNSAQIILLDTNEIALKDSPIHAEKIVGDLMHIPLRPASVDLVALRSVLHYATPDDQHKILTELYRTLKPGGILVSQFGAFTNQEQANTFNGIFAHAQRNVFFCGQQEGLQLHQKIFDEVTISPNQPTLKETFDEFFTLRVPTTAEQQTQAQVYIKARAKALSTILIHSEPPYSWHIPYSIVTCKKS